MKQLALESQGEATRLSRYQRQGCRVEEASSRIWDCCDGETVVVTVGDSTGEER
jgi:hypothetical protein